MGNATNTADGVIEGKVEIKSPCKQVRPRSASPETATANKARNQDKLVGKDCGLDVIRGRLCFAEGPSLDAIHCNRSSGGLEKVLYPNSVKSSDPHSGRNSGGSSNSSSYYMTTRLAPTQAYTNTEGEEGAPTSVTNFSTKINRDTEKQTVLSNNLVKKLPRQKL